MLGMFQREHHGHGHRGQAGRKTCHQIATCVLRHRKRAATIQQQRTLFICRFYDDVIPLGEVK